MTVSGDLSTIDLADLLQNIEAHSRTGTLTLLSDDGEAQLFFRDGRVALLSRPERTPLVELLLLTGHVTRKRLDNARKKQRGTRRPVIEFLVGARVLTIATLREIAEARLGEDVANLIASASGEFRFVEELTPGPDFDADETALQLSLAVAPLVLEATRRVDDWAEIRKFVPSGRMHLRARDGATPPSTAEDQEMAATLLAGLDGSRSAEEIIELVPDHRFQAHKMLSDFVRDRVVRPVDCNEMLEIAEELEQSDPDRAWLLIERALESEPHHVDLLAAKARVAQQLDEPTMAVDAHKLLAHLHLEAEQPEDAHASLLAGQKLAPNDASLWERSLDLAISQGRLHDARHDGLHLVDLYRKPGLHARARAVLDRLLTVEPDATDLHLEFARTCVDCGEPREANTHLSNRAKALVGASAYDDAREFYSEILEIEPNHKEAAVAIDMIDRQEFERRRLRRRRALHHTVFGAVAVAFGLLGCCEVVARIEYTAARSLISSERMLEQGHHQDALAVYQQLASENPFAVTTWFELPTLIADLEARLDER